MSGYSFKDVTDLVGMGSSNKNDWALSRDFPSTSRMDFAEEQVDENRHGPQNQIVEPFDLLSLTRFSCGVRDGGGSLAVGHDVGRRRRGISRLIGGSRDELLLDGADAADKMPGRTQAFDRGRVAEGKGIGAEATIQRVIKIREWELEVGKLQLSTSKSVYGHKTRPVQRKDVETIGEHASMTRMRRVERR